MSKIVFLCVAFQALLIQSAYTQCIQNLGVPNNVYSNLISPNNGFTISGINLAPSGQPVLSNANAINYANAGYVPNAASYTSVVPNTASYTSVIPNAGSYTSVVPNNGINVVTTNTGNVLTSANTVSVGNGNYGGYGTGEVSVLGELPVTGTTLVTGSLPVIGTVQFNGNLPAGGLVSVLGNTPCTCSCY